jgi:NADH-quinone oxidoreductase subunit G
LDPVKRIKRLVNGVEMGKLVTLVIDDQQVEAPEGMLVVDAARKAGINIPVFCYHPKMEPVGMCRMCLVDIGRPVRNRETGEFEREPDGSLKIQFGWKLDTACTVPVSEGMVVRGMTEKVQRARKDIIEFLLTSHPLDCPVCDKGGECPLQNLTLEYGPGKSRFLFDEKMHLGKNIPLGDLIFLDQERCIQCGRCIRFQAEIAGDAVIDFDLRGRSTKIITSSNPGFDSYFSGNTSDICPVGALTTRDFRFGARPWELSYAASICTHCPVGCNLTMNIRREHKSGGGVVIKRVMPRQNEWVNELWICDKGRFSYGFTESGARASEPLTRAGDKLAPKPWEDVLDVVEERLKVVGKDLLVLASGRLSNEDLFNLKQLAEGTGAKSALYTHMAGGELISQAGVGKGTNFKDMGPETAILVAACDLEEEAPLYWLRVNQAAERGATLIVANPRVTKLDRAATHNLTYAYGEEAAILLGLANAVSAKQLDLPEGVRDLARKPEFKAAAQAFAEAENAIILYGSEGVGLESSSALAQACANLLVLTGHVGKPNNGLIAVWERANTQGAWDMGFRPVTDLRAALEEVKGLYVVGADPVGDNPALQELVEKLDCVIVQDLAFTKTAEIATAFLPAQAFTEREGTYTNAERRVQRFYPVVPDIPAARPDFVITALIGERLGVDLEGSAASLVMERIAAQVPDYAGLNYYQLGEVTEQWPIVAREDLYYGGTSYENKQGLGVQLQPTSQAGGTVSLSLPQLQAVVEAAEGMLLAVPVTRLYDRGQTLLPSEVLQPRIPEAYIILSPSDAEPLKVTDGDPVRLLLNGVEYRTLARVDEGVPTGVVLVPRSMDVPVDDPVLVEIKVTEVSTA